MSRGKRTQICTEAFAAAPGLRGRAELARPGEGAPAAARRRLPALREKWFSPDVRAMALCAALFVLAGAAIWPVAEMGIIDDWSYTHIAKDFAATGRITYNGWAAAMVAPQIVWAGGWIRLFGFSFLVVRLSTVALGLLLIPVLYLTGRESGLGREFAAFGVLLTLFSPVVLPLTYSFMSDVPAFFGFAVCFYAALRSCKAAGTRGCLGWAGVSAVAGVASGMDRQIYGLAPLLFPIATGWYRRARKGTLAGLAGIWLASMAATGGFALWFVAQPYVLSEHVWELMRREPAGFLASRSAYVAGKLALTAALLLLPVMAGFLGSGWKRASGRSALAVAAILAAVAARILLAGRGNLPGMVEGGNLLAEFGALRTEGWAPATAPGLAVKAIRYAVTLLLLLASGGCGLALWRLRKGLGEQLRASVAAPALLLGGVFGATMVPGLMVHSFHEPPFDRYLIPLLPLLAIPLLWIQQTQFHARPGLWHWVLLATFAGYGVAGTHDCFAASRALVSAARNLEARGIPRTQIRANWEYDGWTQLEAAGHVNFPQIDHPAGTYRKLTCDAPRGVNPWFFATTPEIRARYFVVPARSPDLEEGAVPPVEYRTWLPAGRREVLTQRVAGGGEAACR